MKVILINKNTNFQTWKNMSVKMPLLWQHQVPVTTTCHTKSFPDKF